MIFHIHFGVVLSIKRRVGGHRTHIGRSEEGA
jgi:hypothetical protein